jgi:hypothetical protein
MLGTGVRKTLVSIISPISKMNYPLRDKIAKDMWRMWSEANSPHLDGYKCPHEFYFMAEIAMKCVVKELDDMILAIVKQRLENLYTQNENNPDF